MTTDEIYRGGSTATTERAAEAAWARDGSWTPPPVADPTHDPGVVLLPKPTA
jgi:hypothetical protein